MQAGATAGLTGPPEPGADPQPPVAPSSRRGLEVTEDAFGCLYVKGTPRETSETREEDVRKRWTGGSPGASRSGNRGHRASGGLGRYGAALLP